MTFLFAPIILGGLIVSVICSVVLEARRTTSKYRHLDWIGTETQSWWGLIKCRFTNVLYLRAKHSAITEEYWSKGKACFVPSALGDHIVIPPNEYEWLLDQSDDALNDTVNLNNELQAEATIGEPFMVHSPTIREIITRNLTRNLTTLTPEIFDELSTAVDEEWGTDTTEWKEVNPFATILKIVARASNRAFVGLPLCRNEKLIHSALSYSATLFPCSIAIRHIPKPLRPLFSPLITMFNQYHRRVVSKLMKSEAQQRLAELSDNRSDSEKVPQFHNDFLQWLIEAALKSNNNYDCDPYILAQRMIILQFVTMYPISGTSTEALFDLISHPDSESIIVDIRKEVNDVFAANNNLWSKRAASQLYKIDSAIRESLRLAPVVAFGSGRHVTAKGGLTTPITKTYLPEGSTVAIPSVAIHQDPGNYDEPARYNPFRFAEKREQACAETFIQDNSDSSTDSVTTRAPPVALSTTSQKYTSFGHGRLACPGRFFASDEMKLFFAYTIQNYDFEVLPQRPERVWAGPFDIPPWRGLIRVKRRENA